MAKSPSRAVGRSHAAAVLAAGWLLLSLGCDGMANLSADLPEGDSAALPSPTGPSEHEALALQLQASPASIRSLSHREYLNALSDLIGVGLPLTLIKDWTPNSQFSGFDSILWTNFDTKSVRDRLALVETVLDSAVTSPKVMTCAATTQTDLEYPACAQNIIEPIAERAFRRPLQVEELASLRSAYEKAVALAKSASMTAPNVLLQEGVRAGLANVFLAPQFFIQSEGSADPSFVGERKLTSFELASKVSFFFTGSLPDDELWEAARSGALLEQEVLERHVARLLMTKTDRFVEAFMGQWLGVRDYAAAAQGSLEHSMWMEAKLTLTEIVRNGLPTTTLLQPEFTYLNRQLATHYGIEGEFGADFRRVTTTERGGVLQLASVLTATSTPLKTSPLRRGRWVQGRLLCKIIPLPGPELFEEIKNIAESIPADATVKERMNLHRTASPVCYTCHKFMDPIGLGLESFDQQGRKRTHYDGDPTKPVETDSDLLGTPFQDFAQLNELLMEMPDVKRCVAEKIAIQALGRVIDSAEGDEGLISYLAWSEPGRKSNFLELALRMVRSKPFLNVVHSGDLP